MGIVCAIKRVLLGKSSHEYMTQFTGNQEYWDRIVAAQLACSSDPPTANMPAAHHPNVGPGDNDEQTTGNAESTGTQQASESRTDPLCRVR
jgi:hypothetical protein